MKASRTLPLLAVLPLVLSLALSADTRGLPATDARPEATIEGTITHLAIPFVGPGPIVTLLGGLVSFDAAGATVRHVSGRVATTADLAVGQRILALLDASAAPPKATTIVLLAERAEITVTGRVQAVDTAGQTITLLGLTLKVTGRTVFGGPWDGAGHRDLGDVATGDLVLVEAKAESGALVATKVTTLSSPSDSLRRIHGTVASIGEASITITLADRTTVVVKIGPETRIGGDPKVGDTVEVVARLQSDGSLLAVLIQRTGPPPAVTYERFEGVAKSAGASSFTITPKGGGADLVFAVDSRTLFLGNPRVGDTVGILAEKRTDGSWLAVVIARTILPGPPRG